MSLRRIKDDKEFCLQNPGVRRGRVSDIFPLQLALPVFKRRESRVLFKGGNKAGRVGKTGKLGNFLNGTV